MNLQANELRIGNRVEYILDEGKLNREEYYWHLNIINAEDILWLSKNYDTNYRPIPLTEKWLLKFGFKKESDSFYRKKESNLIEVLFHDNGIMVTNQSVSLNHIQYIHQLQNLYFALTGFELTINN
jgi:hypothetical protein